MNIVFEVSGGIGKSVMATAVVSCIKKTYPEANIIVVTAYPEVFLNNPEVYRALPFNSLYFFETYVKEDTKIFKLEPYQTEDFIKGKKHLIEIWCELFGLVYEGELPKLYLTEFELTQATNKYKKEKPLLVIQPFGGANTAIKYSWNRDIPITQARDIVAKYKDHDVLQIGREDQPTVARKITALFREIAALIAVSDKRIFIDSFSQHIASALNLPSTVLWITNKPTVFGYDINTNIQARPFDMKIRPTTSYLEEFDFTGGNSSQYPYDNDQLFNLNDI